MTGSPAAAFVTRGWCHPGPPGVGRPSRPGRSAWLARFRRWPRLQRTASGHVEFRRIDLELVEELRLGVAGAALRCRRAQGDVGVYRRRKPDIPAGLLGQEPLLLKDVAIRLDEV